MIDGQYQYSFSESDGIFNNAYKGLMTTKEGEKLCNWGDFRIPGAGITIKVVANLSPKAGEVGNATAVVLVSDNREN